MKNKLLFLVFVLLHNHSFSQINFESGYFINNDGERIDCWIKNVGWGSNPNSFTYRLQEGTKSLNRTVNDTREFGILDRLKFVRHNVKLDRTNINMNKITEHKTSIIEEETLFLKTLVEGKTTLLAYTNKSQFIYLVQIGKSTPEQLVNKVFYNSKDEVMYNKAYLRKLNELPRYEHISFKEIQKLKYRKKELQKFFINYNNCQSSDVVVFQDKNSKGKFNFSIHSGLNLSSFSMRFNEDNATDSKL